MKTKLSILAIVAVITAVFTTTLVMSLTVQLAAAVCSPKSGACAFFAEGPVATTGPSPTNPNAFAGARGGAGFEPGAGTHHSHIDASAGTTMCGGKPEVTNHGQNLCAS